MADKDLRYQISADDSAFGRAMTDLGVHLGQLNSRIDATFTGMSGSFSRMSNVLTGLTGLLFGGSLLDGMREVVNMQDQMSEGAQRVGMLTESWSQYVYAAKLSGIETADLSKAVTKLSGTLLDAQQGQKEAVALFARLKIDPKNIQDADQLLLALADRFNATADGATKTALAADTFGEKLGPKMVPLLNEGRAGIEALRREASQLGVVVTTEAGKAAEAFNDDLDRLKSAGQGAANVLFTRLQPSLSAVAQAMVQTTKDSQGFETASIGLTTVFQNLSIEGARSALVVKSIGVYLGAVAAQFEVLRTSGISGWTALGKEMRDEIKKAYDDYVAFQKKVLEGPSSSAAPAVGSPDSFVPGPKLPPPPPSPRAAAKPKAEFVGPPLPDADWYAAQLDARRLAYAQENQMREMSKAEEAAYWRDVLANQAISQAGRLDITRRVSQLELETLRQAAAQREQMDALVRQRGEASALGAIDMAQQEARAAYEVQSISYAQLLEQEAQFEQQRAEIRRAYLQAKLQNIDPERDPVAYQQVLLQLEDMERQHVLRLAQIKAETAAANAPGENRFLATLESGFENVVNGILNRTMTLRSAWQSALSSMGAGLAKTAASMLSNWIKTQLQMQVASKQTSLAEIHQNAMAAGSAAYKAVAGIPYVGPFLAPAAAAVAYAGTMAFASAEGGYDIPAGVNPVTQLHQREMVLPQEQADAVRSMAAGGASGAPFQLIASPMPGGFWAVHEDEFTRFFKTLQRDRKI